MTPTAWGAQSGTAVKYEVEEVETTGGYFGVHPQSRFRGAWVIVLLLTNLYVVCSTSFRVGFAVHDTALVAVGYSCDIIFVLHILLSFRTGYHYRGSVERDVAQIAARYLRGGIFWLDVASILPVGAIAWAVSGKYNALLHINRMLRVWRLRGWLREVFSRVDPWMITSTSQSLLNMLLHLAVVIHTVACFYFGVTHLEGYASVDTDFLPPATLASAPVWQRYINSLWFVVRPRGFGAPLAVHTTLQAAVSTVVTVVGLITSSIVVGTLGHALASSDLHAVAFQRTQEAVERFVVRRALPHAMRRKLNEFFRVFWAAQHGIRVKQCRVGVVSW